jgi:hypothetical protein
VRTVACAAAALAGRGAAVIVLADGHGLASETMLEDLVAAVYDADGKTRLAQNLGKLYGSNTDLHSKWWAGLEILGQPCEFQVSTTR